MTDMPLPFTLGEPLTRTNGFFGGAPLPDVGRVSARHPDTAHEAARKVPARDQRQRVWECLDLNGPATADTIAATIGAIPNHVATRLQELWEEGRAAVQREFRVCIIGVCFDHDKRATPKVIHYPQDACEVHGETIKGLTRSGRRAASWVALP